MTLSDRVREHVTVTDRLELRTRLEYEKAPAHTTIGHHPVPYTAARDHKLAAYMTAYRTALAGLHDDEGHAA